MHLFRVICTLFIGFTLTACNVTSLNNLPVQVPLDATEPTPAALDSADPDLLPSSELPREKSEVEQRVDDVELTETDLTVKASMEEELPSDFFEKYPDARWSTEYNAYVINPEASETENPVIFLPGMGIEGPEYTDDIDTGEVEVLDKLCTADFEPGVRGNCMLIVRGVSSPVVDVKFDAEITDNPEQLFQILSQGGLPILPGKTYAFGPTSFSAQQVLAHNFERVQQDAATHRVHTSGHQELTEAEIIHVTVSENVVYIMTSPDYRKLQSYLEEGRGEDVADWAKRRYFNETFASWLSTIGLVSQRDDDPWQHISLEPLAKWQEIVGKISSELNQAYPNGRFNVELDPDLTPFEAFSLP